MPARPTSVTPTRTARGSASSWTVTTSRRSPSTNPVVYRARPAVGGIVHTHSPFATAFATLGKPIAPCHYLVATVGDEVAVAPHATCGTDDLGQAVTDVLGTAYDACLLQNHGVLAVGDSLQDALDNAMIVEFCARIQYQAELLGEPDYLSEAELRRLAAKFDGYGRD